MIASLTGVLKTKTPTEIMIDVQGVGYAVSIPFSTYERLGDVNSTVTLLTSLQVREDALQLFGFATLEERNLFRLLLTVTGIGPKIAQGILSGISARDLRDHILRNNIGALTAIPGIGRKTAERLVLELREKVGKGETDGTVPADDRRTQALMALTSLGYSKQVAEKAVHRALTEGVNGELSLEEIIKRALKHTAAV